MEQKKRLVSISEFMEYTGLGRNSALRFGKEIGCRVKIGKRVLYDLRKADEQINKLAE